MRRLHILQSDLKSDINEIDRNKKYQRYELCIDRKLRKMIDLKRRKELIETHHTKQLLLKQTL